MRIVLALVIGMTSVSAVLAEEFAEQVPVEYIRRATIRYLVDVPEGFDKDDPRKYPLLLFLHGAGERGDDLDQVKVHGPRKYVMEHNLPVILISPQCDRRAWWDADALLAFLDQLEKTYPVDPSRVYVTGLSMGGFATWAIISEAPERFAAAVPICGGGDPEDVGAIKGLPIWVFHGAKDNVVPPERSQEMVDALKTVGSSVKYTVYPDANHDSWTETYNNPAVYEWLLAQGK